MVLGLGRYHLSAKDTPGATACPRVIQVRKKSLSVKGIHIGSSPVVNGLETGRGRRYVLAFKADSSVSESEPSRTDLLSYRSGMVNYRFVVPQYITAYGQTLHVVGSLPELGEWNPQRAPMMTWSDGHQWSLECTLPQRSFEFKITVIDWHGIHWEGGCNRVVHTNDDNADVPVEIVVWLTCNFNATDSTHMQLAVPRASLQDAYETGKATLEFLKLRKSKLGQDNEQASSFVERRQQGVELARLSEAVAEQSTVVDQLSEWLGKGNGASRSASRIDGKPASNGTATSDDDDNQLLLLAIDSVRVPKALRRISFVQQTAPVPLPLGSSDASVGNGNGSSAAVMAATPHSPFLRGELDSRAEDLMSAAGVLLQELKSFDAPEPSSVEWASLAQEAGLVAVALEALGGSGTAPSHHVTQLQMRGLASVGNALAGGSAVEASLVEPANNVMDVGYAPVLQVLEAPSVEEPALSGLGAALACVGDMPPVDSRSGMAEAAVAYVAGSTGIDGNGVGGVAASEAPAAGVVGTTGDAGPSSGREVGWEAVEGVGRPPASRTAPVEARPPEAHPLQRLAASVKDAVRARVSPVPGVREPERPHQPGMDDFVRNSITSALVAGNPALSETQQQEPFDADLRKRAAHKFNIRAFLDSLFI